MNPTDLEYIRQRYTHYGDTINHHTAVAHIRALLAHIDGTADNHTHPCENNINGVWCEQWADQHPCHCVGLEHHNDCPHWTLPA
jgi:hypothetical protein